MILLEFMWWSIKTIFWFVARPIIWIITARDCRHCKNGRTNHMGDCFCGFHNPTKEAACKETPWRCYFERK